jgi:hypothetical protein
MPVCDIPVLQPFPFFPVVRPSITDSMLIELANSSERVLNLIELMEFVVTEVGEEPTTKRSIILLESDLTLAG